MSRQGVGLLVPFTEPALFVLSDSMSGLLYNVCLLWKYVGKKATCKNDLDLFTFEQKPIISGNNQLFCEIGILTCEKSSFHVKFL